MNGRLARIVASVIVASLLLTACSSNDGSGDGASSGGRLTKAQFIAKADQICSSANQKTLALKPPTTPAPKVLAKFLSKTGRIISDAADQLKALRPPAADQQKIDTLVNGLEKSANYFPALIKAIKTKDTQKVQQIMGQVRQASLQGTQIARSYGFHVCAQTAAPAPTP
jgi:major membrane immunogen (membrane-anchored lipoprotein)